MVMGHQKQTVDLDQPLMEVARKIRKTVEAVGKDFKLVTGVKDFILRRENQL